jgi:hypothetical protein
MKETNDLRGGLTHRVTTDPYERTGTAGPQQTMKKNGGLLGAAYTPRAKDVLSGRFIVPPFSVLNTREGFWQERKRQWISIGIQSEIGRGNNLLKYSDTILAVQRGDKAFAVTYHTGAPGALSKAMKKKGLTGNTSDIEAFAHRVRKRPVLAGQLARQAGPNGEGKSVYLHPQGDDDETVLGGTSVFDPVLCELVYRWFAPPNGTVLDPFAGGSVRGVVAGELGLQYVGVDLSERQLIENRKQVKAIGTIPEPLWLCGDSTELDTVLHPLFEDSEPDIEAKFDLLFSCPPYGDLEVYSEDPHDISTMTMEKFDEAYAKIIFDACRWLKDGAFAVFVVGDYRSKDGYYRNFPAKTVEAFAQAGLEFYNDIILLNATGSLPLRVGKQFNGSRKVGKCHQSVLVFSKGNPRDFVKGWGDVF